MRVEATVTLTEGRCPDSDGPTMERGSRRGRHLLDRTVDDGIVNDKGPATGPETDPDT